jgi:hypothetical protein
MWPIDPFQRHQKEEARFDYFYKSNSVFIILLNVIKFECGLEMGLIIFVCKPDNGIRVETEVETSEALCYAGRSPFMSWKGRNSLSNIHTSTPHNLNAIWLVSWESIGKNVLL